MVEQAQQIAGGDIHARLAACLFAGKRVCYALPKAYATKTSLQGMIRSLKWPYLSHIMLGQGANRSEMGERTYKRLEREIIIGGKWQANVITSWVMRHVQRTKPCLGL